MLLVASSLALVAALPGDAGMPAGCRLSDVDRSSSLLDCGDHDVGWVDLLPDAVTAAPGDAGVASEPDAGWLEALRTIEQFNFRTAAIKLAPDVSQPAGVVAFDGGVFVSTLSPGRLYLCRSSLGQPEGFDRCHATLAWLLGTQQPGSSDNVCTVKNESSSALTRECGRLLVLDVVSHRSIEQVRAEFEADALRTVRERHGAKARTKTVTVERGAQRWAGWVGFAQFPYVDFVAMEKTERGLRTVMCGPRVDGETLPQLLCPLLVAELLTEPDPITRADVDVAAELFGQTIVLPKGCALEKSTKSGGSITCDNGRMSWWRGHGKLPTPKKQGPGKSVPCTLAGQATTCTLRPAKGKLAAETSGWASNGAEWALLICQFAGEPNATCGDVIVW